MNKSDVSVIITHYNNPNLLKEAYYSVLKQKTSLSLEIIVVDDYSEEKHQKSLKSFMSIIYDCPEYNSIEKQFLFLPYNKKLPGARNEGISASKGDWIICLDGDDMLPNNYIQENYNNIIDNSVHVSYTASRCFGSKNTIYPWPEFSEINLKTGNFINCSAMYPKWLWEKVKGYDESFLLGWEDYEFWIRLYKAGARIKRCSSTYLLWRQHEDSSQMTQSITKTSTETIKTQLKKKHPNFYIGD